jgi:hypothetical protein
LIGVESLRQILPEAQRLPSFSEYVRSNTGAKHQSGGV